jgi:DNA ligase D-like protein (predicted ligase)
MRRSLPETTAQFIEPMECAVVTKLPPGREWVFEIKLDGYRAITVKSGGLNLFSRRRKPFTQYPQIVQALGGLPEGTVLDGEIVALDDEGRPNFNLLQRSRAESRRICYFVFDLVVHQNRDVTGLRLAERRELLETILRPNSRIRILDQFEVRADDIVAAVREQKLEGVIAKHKDSHYEPGKRTGSWVKYRVNRGQEFVIGGYIPGPHGFDSLILGYYRGKDLVYVARTRNGFVPVQRREIFQKLRGLVSSKMPFVNLPDKHPSRWGESLTAEKMKQCIWLRPEMVAQIEFVEWTEADRLRHSKFVRLRDDKDPQKVVKEHAGEA